MTGREQLIALLQESGFIPRHPNTIEDFADFLLSFGLVLRKDCAAPAKWVSVEDALPDFNGKFFCRLAHEDDADSDDFRILLFSPFGEQPHFEIDDFFGLRGLRVTHWADFLSSEEGQSAD